MLASPILHCKTYDHDFRGGLLFAPNDLDIDWAREYILDSTRQIEMATRVRWVMFSNETHIVTGVTCTIADLFKECNRNDIDKYHRDCEDRDLYGFIGYCIKKQSVTQDDGLIATLSELLNLYLEKISIRWNETENEGLISKQTHHCNYTKHLFAPIKSQDKKTCDIIQHIDHKDMRTTDKFVHGSNDYIDFSIFQTVALMSLKTRCHLSICTNLPNQAMASNTVFLLSTCHNAKMSWEHMSNNNEIINRSSKESARFSSHPAKASTGRQRDLDILNEAMNPAKANNKKPSGLDALKGRLGGIMKQFEGNDAAMVNRGEADEVSEISNRDLKKIVDYYINEKCSKCPYKRG